MLDSDLILFEEDLSALEKYLSNLIRESEANAAFLIDKNGQQITASGNYDDIDTTALATLTAGNVAATDGLAKLLGEKGFTILFHEGEQDNIHISIVGDVAILVVIFDDKTSVGMVRLRVKQATSQLEEALVTASKRTDKREEAVREGRSRLADITDEDIDNLFSKD
jgi:predicted regulator of Ras-like GTPase activity (Roadblock/LC7/MglB family)